MVGGHITSQQIPRQQHSGVKKTKDSALSLAETHLPHTRWGIALFSTLTSPAPFALALNNATGFDSSWMACFPCLAAVQVRQHLLGASLWRERPDPGRGRPSAYTKVYRASAACHPS